ncbi:MAG TPA: M55 family metallopeptidase [Armatimonadetes bacterium]|jgi:D-amino peptidase|nr:M55 family metallopeptidase [Armatimonadota bacterium]
MRVLICTDLEGISGVCVWEQTREMTTEQYQDARRLLMGDVAAAVEGCREGGADDILVLDGHGGGFNFIPEMMHPGARYLTGRARPRISEYVTLFQSFNAAILLGYHAMAGTPDGILAHTQSSRGGNRYWYNGRECGEIAQSALTYGSVGIPVVMVSGDAATCREAREFLGDAVVTVSVKEGYGEQFGALVPPLAAHTLLREGACEAMARVAQCHPFVMETPIQGRLRFPDKSTADGFRPVRAKRVDDYTFEAQFADARFIHEF